MHDPEVFEAPHEFRPERFIRDGKLYVGVRDPTRYIFGYGRRWVSELLNSDVSPWILTELFRLSGSVPVDTSQKTHCSSTSPVYCTFSTLVLQPMGAAHPSR